MTATVPARAARAYCRAVLPRVSRTFAINIELLDDRLRDCVRTAYLLCRAADALEDSWTGTPAELGEAFERFLAALAGDTHAERALAAEAARRAGEGADLELLAHLPLVLADLRARPAEEQVIVRDGVRTLAAGMYRFAVRAAERPADTCYVDDDAELSDYCWVVAGCVGAMLTRLFERRLDAAHDPQRDARRALAPVVGEALQLTNILLDLPGDVRQGRCYLPASWLAPYGLTPRDLAGPETPAGRALAERLAAQAHGALDRVADYLDTIPTRHVRYRLFCLWPALWARASLGLVERDPHYPCVGARARLGRGRLWLTAARSLLVAHDHRGVRRLIVRA